MHRFVLIISMNRFQIDAGGNAGPPRISPGAFRLCRMNRFPGGRFDAGEYGIGVGGVGRGVFD